MTDYISDRLNGLLQEARRMRDDSVPRSADQRNYAVLSTEIESAYLRALVAEKEVKL